MKKHSRRDFMRNGIGAVVAPKVASAFALPGSAAGSSNPPLAEGEAATSGSLRERLLLDFGWWFHLGDACVAEKDFGWGIGGPYFAGTFGKSGTLIMPGTVPRPRFHMPPSSPGGPPPELVTPGHPVPHYKFKLAPVKFAPPPKVEFDTAGWQKINLPHDWAVELPFVDRGELGSHGFKPLGRDFPSTSIGWYRREFDLAESDRGKRLSVEFDGVFRNAMVLFNGYYLGVNFSGYAPFRFDITDFARYGDKNELVVRVDATIEEGWFYEGAGIYRHVWLVKTHPLHVPQWGTIVRSEVKGDEAALQLTTEVSNAGDDAKTSRVHSQILDPQGKIVATVTSKSHEAKPWATHKVSQEIQISRPMVWSLEEPNLYRLISTVEAEGKPVDRYETFFGIRAIRFDVNQGFFLNGKHVKIQGTCNHQDFAGIGSALPDRVQSYRLERLKAMGSNAIRTSHNPPTPELLDACDRLGILVMDETRMMSSSPEGLSELERMVRRDRNHPSIVIWSLGNEEPEQVTRTGYRVVTTMKRLVRKLDPTRLCTAAMNYGWGEGISYVLDVQGCNYSLPGIDVFHRKFPNQPMIGTETASTVSDRGVYSNDYKRCYVSAYDVNYPMWAETAEQWWSFYAARPFLAGGFAWTGFDYRGEETPYSWPDINSHFGIMDTCGFAKDNFFYYKAWWGSQPVLHLFPHWNWAGKEGQDIEVWAHSNLDRVELLVNGKSVGAKDVPRYKHVAWNVPFEPGAIEARGYKAGRWVLTARRETTGLAAKVVLWPDRKRIAANGEDVSLITVEIVDAKGRMTPTAGNRVQFKLSGSGKLIGVGNGDPACHESDKGDSRSAFNGLCMAIVQSTQEPGTLKVEASSAGLQSAEAEIVCEPARLRPAVG